MNNTPKCEKIRVSEKSLELNVGSELLFFIRDCWGFNKAYLRGLTQKEEKEEGVDFFLQLSPDCRLFAFQFKAPLSQSDTQHSHYHYTLKKNQHEALFRLSNVAPNSVYYVFPFYKTLSDFQKDVPNLLQNTWFLKVKDVDPTIFKPHQKTCTILCKQYKAKINPEYNLYLFNPGNNMNSNDIPSGIKPNDFKIWHNSFKEIRMRKDSWLVRGLRLAIYCPNNDEKNISE